MTRDALPGGMWAVIEPRPTGFGPVVFVGDVRGQDGRPIAEQVHGERTGHWHYPVTVGTTETAVLAVLTARAERLAMNDTAGITA